MSEAQAVQEQINIHPTKVVAVRGNQEIELTLTELKLLGLFIENRGEIVDRPTVHQRIWSDKPLSKYTNLVDVYVAYLRNKLGKEAIVAVRGAGYKLVA